MTNITTKGSARSVGGRVAPARGGGSGAVRRGRTGYSVGRRAGFTPPLEVGND